ncbi:MAG: Hsp70 family protein [Clostridiales bacterium]|nr:Hsp70 family protein [Clostridiales bacterium]
MSDKNGRIVGIDLGTSTSEISCIIDGKPVIIPNTLGKPVTPSVVHIGESELLIGEHAAEYLFTQPECTFMEVKRMTGTDQKLTVRGKEYTTEEIQSMLIEYLIDCAEIFLDEKITRAVITVPAYFTDRQRRATARAGELAGLTVERILNEPTAAALDYGLQNLTECKNILVYDLGGGTLDITVMELFEGVIDVKASSGNNHLGGKDFDEILMRQLCDSLTDERARMRLKKAAEECKVALSEKESHEISLPFLYTTKRGKPISLEKTVTRTEFESWIKEKVDSTRDPIQIALSDAKLAASDLDAVLLVGGSTRIPCVKRLVEETLGMEAKTLVDPDLTVARGAAVQAGILDGLFSDGKDIVLTDVCPYTLGISVLYASGLLDNKMVFSPIIQRNTTIPVERTERYCTANDYQTAVEIKVYQGESTNPDNNEPLGDMLLRGLPPAKAMKESVDVTFAYDINGILQVTAKVVSTGKQATVEISTAGVQAKPPLDLSKWEEVSTARRFRPAIRKAEKRIASKHMASSDLQILVTEIKEALLLGDEAQAEDLREELLDLLEDI